MNQLDWTDEQWDAYYRRTVTIGVDFLESIATGIDLLCRGARLNAEERERWRTTNEQLKERLDRECRAIQEVQG